MTKGISIFRSIVLSVMVVTGFAIATHWIKSEVILKEDQLAELKTRIETEENRIMVFEADWAYLTRPERIERLARERLSYAPVDPDRILSLDSISDEEFSPSSPEALGLFRTSDGGGR
jgi:hypothetical protein